MELFNSMTKLKKLASMVTIAVSRNPLSAIPTNVRLFQVIADQVHTKEAERLRQIFESMDRTNSGTITRDELQQAMQDRPNNSSVRYSGFVFAVL